MIQTHRVLPGTVDVVVNVRYFTYGKPRVSSSSLTMLQGRRTAGTQAGQCRRTTVASRVGRKLSLSKPTRTVCCGSTSSWRWTGAVRVLDLGPARGPQGDAARLQCTAVWQCGRQCGSWCAHARVEPVEVAARPQRQTRSGTARLSQKCRNGDAERGRSAGGRGKLVRKGGFELKPEVLAEAREVGCACEGRRPSQKRRQGAYWLEVYLVTALVPSGTACRPAHPAR